MPSHAQPTADRQGIDPAVTTRTIAFLAVLLIGALMIGGQLYQMVPLTGLVSARYGVSAGHAALSGAAFGVTYALGCLIWGPISDRFGRGRVIIPGLVAAGLAIMLVALSRTFVELLMARALEGYLAAAFTPAAIALVAESLPLRRRPIGVAAISLCFLGAAPLTQLAAAALEPFGLPIIMLIQVPICLVIAIGIALLIERRFLARPVAPVKGSLSRRVSLHRERLILAAWGGIATVLFAYVLFQAAVQELRQVLPVNLVTLRSLMLPALLACLAAPPLIGRLGPSMTGRIGLAAISLGLLLAALHTNASLLAGGVVLTIGVAIAVPGLLATIVGQSDTADRGLAVAISMFLLFLGASVAPIAAHTLADGGIWAVCVPPALLSLLGLLGLWTAAGAHKTIA